MRHIRIKTVAYVLISCFVFSSCLTKPSGTLLSIYEISEAIRERNFDKMTKYIDVDGILADCVDVTFQEMKNKLGLFGQLIDVASLAKPRLVSVSKSQLKSMVETGQLDQFAIKKELLLSSILGAKILSLFKKAKSKERLKVVERKATERGEELLLKIRLSPTSDWIPFHLESVRKGNIYRIIKIKNLEEIKGDILKEFLSGLTP